MEGRRIRGEGLDHEQDYIRERIEQAGDTDEYAEAAERLEGELHDFQNLTTGDTQGTEPNMDLLEAQANVPVEGAELRQGEALDVTTDTQVDLGQLPPDAEARGRMTSGVGGGITGS